MMNRLRGKATSGAYFLLGILCILLLSGCDGEPAFELRYVFVPIPGFTGEDYLQMLDSDDPNFRYIAMGNLVNMQGGPGGDSSLAEKVAERAEALLRDDSPKVRAITAHCTKSLGVARFEAPLIKLTADPSDAVRVDAITALAEKYRDSERAVDAILNCLNDSNAVVRLSAVEALRHVDRKFSSNATQRLLSSLSAKPIAEKLKAIAVVGELACPGPDELAFPDAEETLLSMLSSSDKRIVSVTVKALGGMQSERAVTPLVQLIKDDQDNMADSIAAALNCIGSEEARQALLQLVNHEKESVRLAAIRNLGAESSKEGLPLLMTRFHQQEMTLREKMSDLRLSDFASAFPELHSLYSAIKGSYGNLSQAQPDAPSPAAMLRSDKLCEKLMVLENLGDGAPFDGPAIAVPDQGAADLWKEVAALTESPSVLVRLFALKALGNSVNEGTLPLLKSRINDAVPGVRYAAIAALITRTKEMEDFALARFLYEKREDYIPHTYDPKELNFDIRLQIEQMVAALERPQITYTRRARELKSTSTPTRLIAALRLAGQGDKIAADPLLSILESGSPVEAEHAWTGLQNILSPEAIPRLKAIRGKIKDEGLRAQIDGLIEKLSSEQKESPERK